MAAADLATKDWLFHTSASGTQLGMQLIIFYRNFSVIWLIGSAYFNVVLREDEPKNFCLPVFQFLDVSKI
jgi:hypothetical protein